MAELVRKVRFCRTLNNTSAELSTTDGVRKTYAGNCVLSTLPVFPTYYKILTSTAIKNIGILLDPFTRIEDNFKRYIRKALLIIFIAISGSCALVINITKMHK
jgi:hypothetical protein